MEEENWQEENWDDSEDEDNFEDSLERVIDMTNKGRRERPSVRAGC